MTIRECYLFKQIEKKKKKNGPGSREGGKEGRAHGLRKSKSNIYIHTHLARSHAHEFGEQMRTVLAAESHAAVFAGEAELLRVLVRDLQFLHVVILKRIRHFERRRVDRHETRALQSKDTVIVRAPAANLRRRPSSRTHAS
jgi:hypothetical protein